MKKLLILLISISLNANEVIELIIKPKIVETINIENKSKNCDFWNMQNKLSRINKKLFDENIIIKETLRKRHINYRIILKQRVKKDRIDINAIRNELCDKSYFYHKSRLTKNIDKYSQENIILKELLEKNYITIEPKKDSYYKKEKTIDLEHEEAKENLKKQMLQS